METEYLTTDQASLRFGFSAETINRWIREGKLPAIKMDRQHGGSPCDYITARDIERVIAQRKVKPGYVTVRDAARIMGTSLASIRYRISYGWYRGVIRSRHDTLYIPLDELTQGHPGRASKQEIPEQSISLTQVDPQDVVGMYEPEHGHPFEDEDRYMQWWRRYHHKRSVIAMKDRAGTRKPMPICKTWIDPHGVAHVQVVTRMAWIVVATVRAAYDANSL